MKVTKTILVAMTAALLLVGAGAQAGMYSTATDTGAMGTITTGVGLASSITTSGFAGTVDSVTVSLQISGGNNGDLYGYLSYNGVLVTILNRPGVTGSNPFGDAGGGYNVFLTDSSSVNLSSATGSTGNPTMGAYNVNGTMGVGGQVNGALAFEAFNGAAANGTWTLFLENGVSGGDPSTLVSWSIGINAVPEPTNVALGIFGVCAVAGRLRAGWKKARVGAKSIGEPK